MGHPLFQPPRLSGVHAIQLRRPKPAYSGTPAPAAAPGSGVAARQGPRSAPGQVPYGTSHVGADLCAKCRRCAAVALRKAACGPHCPHRPFPRMSPSALRGGPFAWFSGFTSPARNIPTLMPSGFVLPGVTSNKGGQGAGTFCGMSMPSAPRLPGGNQFPPDAPLRSPRGFFCTILRVTFPCAECFDADAPRFRSPGGYFQ